MEALAARDRNTEGEESERDHRAERGEPGGLGINRVVQAVDVEAGSARERGFGDRVAGKPPKLPLNLVFGSGRRPRPGAARDLVRISIEIAGGPVSVFGGWTSAFRLERLGEVKAAPQPSDELAVLGDAFLTHVDHAAHRFPGEIHLPGVRLA